MKLWVDGQELNMDGRPTVLEAARRAGIEIPTLCELAGTEPYAGCRLCLVELEGRKGYTPACATPAADGMKVRTRTSELVALRKKILSLILAEHPHGCLACGERAGCADLKAPLRKTEEVTGCMQCPSRDDCGLEKAVREVGLDVRSIPDYFRNAPVHREDPFIDRDLNLCILCGRCVRVCKEVRGASVLDFVNRGSETLVGTSFDRTLLDSGCQFCGACVDACPTGALAERAVRYDPPADGKIPVVCRQCSQGCRLDIYTNAGKPARSRPAESPVNRDQACVRGRFMAVDSRNSDSRILQPWVREDGELRPVGWEKALRAAGDVLAACAGDRSALILPTDVPLEDIRAFLAFGRKVMRTGIVSTGEASAWEVMSDFGAAHGMSLSFNFDFSDIEKAGAVLVLTSETPSRYAMAWLRILQARKNGAAVILTSPAGPSGQAKGMLKLPLEPGKQYAALERLAVECGRRSRAGDRPLQERAKAPAEKKPPVERENDDIDRAADLLMSGRPAVIILDGDFLSGRAGRRNMAAVWNLGLLVGARLIPLGRTANERGVFELRRTLGGDFPRVYPRDIQEGIKKGGIKLLFLAAGTDFIPRTRPELLLFQGVHWTDAARAADVVLPASHWLESSGTVINTEGRVLTSEAAVAPAGLTKPDREILDELCRILTGCGLDLSGFAAFEKVVAADGREKPGAVDPLSAGHFVKETAAGGLAPVEPTAEPEYPASCPLSGMRLIIKPNIDSCRGYPLTADSRGLALLRREGLVFLHPADAAELGLEQGVHVKVETQSGAVEALASVHSSCLPGFAEFRPRASDPSLTELSSQDPVPVTIRRSC